MKHLLIFILTLSISNVFAQEKDKALLKSNDFVYQGNTLIENDFISAEIIISTLFVCSSSS